MKKKKSRTKKTLLAIAAILLLIIVAGGVFANAYLLKQYEYEPVRLHIPAGASPAQVEDSLIAVLGKDFGSKTADLWRWQGGIPAKARGSYVVKPGMTALQLSRRLKAGRQSPVRVTFNNIRTLSDLAARIASRMEFGADDFLRACDSILPPLGFESVETYPAAFLPDTYEYFWTDKAEKVVADINSHRGKFWTDERRQKARSLGLTPVEVATIASIVEEETAKTDERPKVARLYLNRLKAGMPLQADPTVKFAVGDFSLRRIGGKLLKTDSPYNTYICRGLPPGPIRIPERATLDAVLDAPEHDYLYMCAKSDFSGYHNFATTFDRHRINSARYHAALNKRGIK